MYTCNLLHGVHRVPTKRHGTLSPCLITVRFMLEGDITMGKNDLLSYSSQRTYALDVQKCTSTRPKQREQHAVQKRRWNKLLTQQQKPMREHSSPIKPRSQALYNCPFKLSSPTGSCFVARLLATLVPWRLCAPKPHSRVVPGANAEGEHLRRRFTRSVYISRGSALCGIA